MSRSPPLKSHCSIISTGQTTTVDDFHGGWLVRVHGLEVSSRETKPEGWRGKIHIWTAGVSGRFDVESRASCRRGRRGESARSLIRCSRENDNENVSAVSPMAIVSNDISPPRLTIPGCFYWISHSSKENARPPDIRRKYLSVLHPRRQGIEKLMNVRIEAITRQKRRRVGSRWKGPRKCGRERLFSFD